MPFHFSAPLAYAQSHLRCVVLFVLLLSALSAQAQAKSTADRTTRLDVFAGGSVLQTDYATRDSGFMVGGDVTRHFHLVDLALDVRYVSAKGAEVNESSFGGGLKVTRTYHQLHPYVTALIGFGNIAFVHPVIQTDGKPYAHDDSKVYDAGGGLDYDLSRSFAVEFDAQLQFWRLGIHAPLLTPAVATVGLVYRIPHRSVYGN